MKVHLRTTIEIETGRVLEDIYYEYSGPVAEAKKGKKRKKEEQAAQKRLREQAERDAAAARAKQEAEYGGLQQILGQLTPPTGEVLSPWTQAGYWGVLDDISRTYGSLREAGLRTLMRSGFGRAPSGMRGSYMAGSQRGEAQDKARALWEAIGKTGEDLKYVGGQRAGMTQFFDPQSRMAQASDISMRRFGMDIEPIWPQIVGGIASLAAIPFTGGASLAGLGGLIKPTASGTAPGGYRWSSAGGSTGVRPVSSTSGGWG